MNSKIISLIAVAASVFTAGQALAQSSPKWGGLYIGAGIGGLGVSGTETDTHTAPPGIDKFDVGTDWGVLGTVTAGYDLQLPQGLVVGAFTEFDFTNAEADGTSPGGDTSKLAENHAFNVGGRVGVLISSATLLFADGGYTRGDFEFKYIDPGVLSYSKSKSFDGWFVGGGAEQKLTDALSIKIEYRFAQYGKENVGFIVVDNVSHAIDADTQSIRVGLTYNLGIGQ